MIRVNNLSQEERFSRTLFGTIMIASLFVEWGRWVVLALGVLFIVSSWLGYCPSCEANKKN